jgi:3-hydroxyacyl-CoA dehydrogenase
MDTRPFETIGIVGAGAMGAQIALHCAVYSYPVQLFSRLTKTLILLFYYQVNLSGVRRRQRIWNKADF